MSHRRRGARTNGQALAEFAFAIPIFLIIILALIDVGRGVFMYSGLTNGAREAARLAVVNQDEAAVAQRAQAMSFGVTIDTPPADLVDFYRPVPNIDDVESNTECSNGTDHPIAVGCIAVVRTQGNWQPIALAPVTWLLAIVMGAPTDAPYGAITLEARSELPIEFECPNASIPAYADPAACPKQP